jgi:Tfp pilus assembly pilus retraction ATPase PilT
VTPVGNIELEIVFRIAVRGRAGDLAQLMEAVNQTHAVVMWFVENPIESEEQGQNGVTTTAEQWDALKRAFRQALRSPEMVPVLAELHLQYGDV